MATNRSYVRRPHRSRISPDQERDLWLGSRRDEMPFADEDARRTIWERHRDRLIGALPSSPGRRPIAFWQYDAPAAGLRWPDYDRERSTLYEAGLVDGEEKAKLEAEWRVAFEQAQRSGFWLCLGPGEELNGAAARRKHYADADIPAELVKRWTAEYRRAAKAVKSLLGQAQEKPAPT